MNSVWLALMWKEWREHRWKLAALTAILLAGPLMALRANTVDRAGYVAATVMLYAPIAAAFLAMGVAAGERSRGTLPLLQALPLDLRRVAAVKLLAAAATFITPILIVTAALFAVLAIGEAFDWGYALEVQRAFNRNRASSTTGNVLLDLAVLTSLFGVSIICWVAAVGVNRESEVRAGAIGLIMIVGIWTFFANAMYWFDDQVKAALAPGTYLAGRNALVASIPGGIAGVPGMNSTTRWITAVPAFLLTHGALAAWYVTRFGRTRSTNRWSAKPTPKGSVIAEWLDKPRSSPLRALAWKQLRECGPIIVAGLACAVGVALVAAASSPTSRVKLADFVGIVAYGLVAFGYLSGLISGVGASTGDLEPRLLGFWRSRPINVDLWFWSKCATTMLMLLGAFTLPALLLCGTGAINNTRGNPIDGDQLFFLFGLSITPILLGFASGLLAGCVLRRAAYAAILGLALSLGLIVWLTVRAEQSDAIAWMHPLILSTAVLMTLAAWLATRFDWSLRR